MSFSSTAKRRLPWFDTSRLELIEKAVEGHRFGDAIADLVITLFEELAEQSRVRSLAQSGEAREGDSVSVFLPSGAVRVLEKP